MEFIIGIAVGILLGAILFHRRPVGDLRVDRSDPTENPSLFLELERDVWFVSRKRKSLSGSGTKTSSRTNSTPYYGAYQFLKGENEYG